LEHGVEVGARHLDRPIDKQRPTALPAPRPIRHAVGVDAVESTTEGARDGDPLLGCLARRGMFLYDSIHSNEFPLS
jgi:hypothetical protein